MRTRFSEFMQNFRKKIRSLHALNWSTRFLTRFTEFTRFCYASIGGAVFYEFFGIHTFLRDFYLPGTYTTRKKRIQCIMQVSLTADENFPFLDK